MSLLTPTHAAVDPFTFASTSSQEADTDSGSSSSDSDMISTSSPPLSSEVKQTRQGKDWRPKSTLHLKPRSEFDFYDWLADRGKMSDEYHELKPESIERGPIPTHSVLREHAWILPRSLVATGLQQLSYLIFPRELHEIVARLELTEFISLQSTNGRCGSPTHCTSSASPSSP